MARYDRGWRRGPMGGGYERDFRPAGGGQGWGGGPRSRYDRELAMSPEWALEHEAPAGLYGPARYGLGPYHERLRTRRRPDDEVREDVEEALFYDTWVDAEAITVEVREGIVTLRGELPSYEEIRFATDDAWDVDGVLGVRSELSVRHR
jgi:osmotically-inducible protein OsmY